MSTIVYNSSIKKSFFILSLSLSPNKTLNIFVSSIYVLSLSLYLLIILPVNDAEGHCKWVGVSILIDHREGVVVYSGWVKIRDGNGSSSPPRMVLSCLIPAPPRMTGKTFSLHPRPLGPREAPVPSRPVKLYFLLIYPTTNTIF